MPVALDAMGGDYGPGVLVEGAVAAAREGISVTLVGDEQLLKDELSSNRDNRIHIVNATQVAGMDESPSEALRRKKDSTIRVAFDLVKQGKARAVVSAGNSGATLATAMFTLGRIAGVRPAIATMMPTLKQPVVMIDVGANVDCKPNHLLQFGIMGSVFSSQVTGNPAPRVGLLSIGEENSKGNQQVKRAHDLLHSSDLNFVGNVEGRDVFKGDVDVVVCDGFVGNICLKLSEGLAESILTMLKTEIGGDFMASMGYALARSAFKKFKKKVDYSEYGGAPLLGIKGVGIICHGRSSPQAVKNAIRLAHELSSADLVARLGEKLSAGKARLSLAN